MYYIVGYVRRKFSCDRGQLWTSLFLKKACTCFMRSTKLVFYELAISQCLRYAEKETELKATNPPIILDFFEKVLEFQKQDIISSNLKKNRF